ncbi:helix-turn-helix domain-containing protein [Nocardia camponoti]|uniref:HTH cro/C1-type domain-containing protein n=1 Tax=Nocardia camponoti TaxID=1616106 RepID=A0A917QFT3_9NOCA|nr:helix-turn-helix transcriptional regulator [Nocardia camponoti]GGK48493.1 hypothetical protein GCM10011591_19860 [Nocardia camponoti]
MATPRGRVAPHRTAEQRFGVELRARRTAAALSLRQLAPLVNISHDLLARIERAERRAHRDTVILLDQALNADGRLIRLAEPFTAIIATTPVSGDVDPETVGRTLRQLTADVRAADHTMSAGQTKKLIAGARSASSIAMERHPADLRNDLRRGVAEAYQLAGWMLFDRGNTTAADKAFTEARRNAQQANAIELVAFIGGPNAAFMTTWHGDASTGVAQAYGALAWARRSGNRRLSAFVATMAARAHARLGESELCAHMLIEAESELGRHREDTPDPLWLNVFDAAALAGHRGSCMLDLGSPDRAIEAFSEQHAASPDAFLRNRTIWQLEHAAAKIELDEPDAAANSVDGAIDGLNAGPVSSRVLDLFRGVETQLAGSRCHAAEEAAVRVTALIAAHE